MGKYFVTGFPGTGKTSVATELKRRGYYAYDPETMQNYMHLEQVDTGKHIRLPDRPQRGWFDTIGNFNWDLNRIDTLLDSHEDMFICSLADNQLSILDKFDLVFVLSLDDFTLEQRLNHRDGDLSKVPEQLADILTLHRHFEESLIDNHGAIKIDAKPSIRDVTDGILRFIEFV